MKILYFTNVPAPYSVEFFNLLGDKTELTVIYERRVALDRNKDWFKKNVISYKEIFLEGLKKGDDQLFSPKILKYIKQDYDFYIIGDYSSPSGLLLIAGLIFFSKDYVIHADGGIINSHKGIKTNIKKFIFKRAVFCMSSGKTCTKYLTYYGAYEKKCFEYPFASVYKKDILQKPIDSIGKKNLRRKLGFFKEEESFVLLSVGSIIPRKGFDILDDALERLESKCNRRIYAIVIGGSFCKEQNYQNINILPFMHFEEIKKYMRMADLFVHPAREDIWGLVVAEAMTQGLPIVTSDRCMCGVELTDEKNGMIVPNDNPRVLADAIFKLSCYSAERLYEMGRVSIEKSSRYTLENMAEKYYEILQMNYAGADYEKH